MKKISLFFALIILGAGFSAFKSATKLYRWDSGSIHFFSEAPLEDIEANTNIYTGLLSPETKKVAFSVFIKTFQFDKSKMQEHFNENYLESEKYPKATFVGEINEDVDLLKDGTYEVTVTGKLNIHGVEQPRTLSGTVKVKDEKLSLESKFQVKLVDHKIKIPSIVIDNIAEVIDVTVKGEYSYRDK